VARRASRLDRSTCGDATLCVPCFDPVDGTPSSACDLGGDKGPTEPPSLFSDCCGGQARCVPQGLIDDNLQTKLSADSCAKGSETLCVPDLWVADQNAFPSSCSAYNGAEGRCLSRCLADVQKRLERLKQDSCDASALCVPCFDPVTGANTGACTSGNDPGPKNKTPVMFDKCCGSVGRCVPPEALKDSERTQLAADSCDPASGALCVPGDWVSHPDNPPITCRAYGEVEGRCMPSCLPQVQNRSEMLRQNVCPNTFLCVPCFDSVTGENTGSCNVGGDPGPTELPVSFSQCCGDLGRCVPTEAVKDQIKDRLDANSCAQDQPRLCVPEPWIKDSFYVPQTCSAPGALEGRCLPNCLPDVMKRSDHLTAETCPAAHSCVPCFDPVNGDETHACDVGKDAPTAPPKLFPDCCGDQGTCVPGELVSSSDRSRFGVDSCAGDLPALCVPKTWVDQDPLPVPKTCRGPQNGEGRCLSTCLPEVGSRKDQLRQDVCDATELCVPCFDPVDGHDTQACHISKDTPKESPRLFDACCDMRGRCIPPDLVSMDRRDGLGADSCATGGELCVPANWLGDKRSASPSCRGYANAEGRCLPNCLPEVAAQSSKLLTAGCDTSASCVPCYDPVSGGDTGACTAPGDPGPKEPPRTFPTCCDGIGRCVPNPLVDPTDRSRLSADKCDSPSGNVCVPTSWLADDFTTPTQCRAPGNVEGRCLAACLPQVAGRASDLRQTSCANHELCVPCYDPLTGAATDACTTHGDMPREAPKGYQQCCSNDGLCIPGDYLPPLGTYNTESCREAGTFCVPSRAATGLDPFFPGCTDSNLRAGACVPGCYINPWVRLLVSQDTCLQGGTLCVRCGLSSLQTAVCR
jgi:hypothetical protein